MKALKILGKAAIGIVAVLALLFGVFYLLTIGQYTVPDTVATDPSLPHVVIDGVTYHAETYGDAANPVVITIHGGPGGDYRSILPLKALSDEFFVVFIDQRGTGLSPRVDPEQITLESAISDLDSVVMHYGKGEKVNLVGHSWGAMLASAYLGRYSDKVDHAVLAEPGFLTSEFATAYAEQTRIKPSFPVMYHLIKTKFEALHIRKPDDQASSDYFSHEMNMYQGDDHPQAGYRCDGGGPAENESWRYGAQAAEALFSDAVDAKGAFDINLIEGVEAFTNKILFMAGECGTIIGPTWQRRQMEFFHDADLVVIPDAGHEMFSENPELSIAAVREYLHSPGGAE